MTNLAQWVLALSIAPLIVYAQTTPQFEVASIKPNKSGNPPPGKDPFTYSPGRFGGTNVTLVDLMIVAYRVRRARLQGGPNWIDSDRFDVVAKAEDTPGGTKPTDMLPMIRMLLEDRFKLALHTETKELPVYALVLAGKNPPKLQESKEGERSSNTWDQGRMIFHRWPIADGLVNVLANILHTPVVDRTGIKGFYDFTLTPAPPVRRESGDAGPAPPYNFGDAIVAAMEEQLGFKLERQKAPQEITVVDHAERPTEN